jgi:FtsP/CotA-like multicopper oxidase with cupredoxin domain
MCNKSIQLHKELDPTDLWTYDGYYPGRFFIVRSDQTVAVEWVNEIDGTLPVNVVRSGYVPLDPSSQFPENEPGAIDGNKGPKPDGSPDPSACVPEKDTDALPAWTVVHLHGARVAPDSDGWTENAFLPRSIQKASQHSLYPPQPRSMMLWYHDHAYTITRLNVFAGLAGGWIVRGPEEQGLNLPADEFEVPLIIQDRNFDTKSDFLTGRLLHKAETDSAKLIRR